MQDPVNFVDPSGNIGVFAAILIGGVGLIQAGGALLKGRSASQVGQAFATGFISGAVGVAFGAATGIGAILAIPTGLIVNATLNLSEIDVPDLSNGINAIRNQGNKKSCSGVGG